MPAATQPSPLTPEQAAQRRLDDYRRAEAALAQNLAGIRPTDRLLPSNTLGLLTSAQMAAERAFPVGGGGAGILALAAPPAQQPVTPLSSTVAQSIGTGSGIAQQQEQQTLMGGAMSKLFGNGAMRSAVDRLLELSIRPEALTPQLGDRPFQPLMRAASAQAQEDKAVRAMTGAAEQDFAQRAALEQMKGGQLTPFGSQLLGEYAAGQEGARILGSMEELAQTGKVGGPRDILNQVFASLGTPLGFDMRETDTAKFNTEVDKFIMQVSAKRTFGREMTSKEQDMMRNILRSARLTNSPEELLAHIRPLKEELARSQANTRAQIDFLGLAPLARGMEQRNAPGVGVVSRSGAIQ